IDEGPPKQVRMANLAIVGSHATNGVAALHTRLLQERLFTDFAKLWPARFQNKTNGVTPRRWLREANPRLSTLISDAIGTKWLTDLEELRRLEPLANDAGFREKFRKLKHAAKEDLAKITKFDPHSLLSAQIKRFHEYKRQLLNLLHVVALYRRLKA